MALIGRQKEIKLLKAQLKSDQSRIVIVSGRRRVGKTFLVDEVYREHIVFRHTATSPAELMDSKTPNETIMQAQIDDFMRSLKRRGHVVTGDISTWSDAFFELEKYLDSKHDGTKKVVFLDELPWMDTPRSFFLRAFSDFWSNYVLPRKDIVLTVAGSANSWILDNLVYNSGSLYNRHNCKLSLQPFTLKETEEFLLSKGIRYSHYDIVLLYMAFGGIPYYLDFVQKGESVANNIHDLLFGNESELTREFDNLFNSVFAKKEKVISIVRAIAKKRCGITREALSKAISIPEGGGLSSYLSALEAGGFIVEYRPFGSKTAEKMYRLVDPFALFILRFVEPLGEKAASIIQSGFRSPTLNSWKGLTFEIVVMNHIQQIKDALRIGGVISEEASFFEKGDKKKEGAQIDLLIIRDDDIVNLCEAKFVSEVYAATKKDETDLARKESVIKEHLRPRNSLHRTLITTFGLAENEYSSIYDRVITIDDLFRY